MNLDLNMLKEMIASTLTELSNPLGSSTEDSGVEAATASLEAAEDSLEAAEKTRDETEKEQEATKRKQNGSPQPPEPSTLPESFQITKGRLRQIIAEELISAKKQGIL